MSITFDCNYMLELLQKKYESWGGSRKYLRDPSRLPKEIKAARELIIRLCHCPHTLMSMPELVAQLLDPGSPVSLSPSQLLHIGSLVAMFSSMCTFAQALQIQTEVRAA